MNTDREKPQTKNTLDTHAPDRQETQQLSETEKKQIELGGQIEHEQGEKREATAEKAEQLDSEK